MILEPTTRLRWIEREVKLDGFFEVYDNTPTVKVLQQWHKNIAYEKGETIGEWRDIEIEKI